MILAPKASIGEPGDGDPRQPTFHGVHSCIDVTWQRVTDSIGKDCSGVNRYVGRLEEGPVSRIAQAKFVHQAGCGIGLLEEDGVLPRLVGDRTVENEGGGQRSVFARRCMCPRRFKRAAVSPV